MSPHECGLHIKLPGFNYVSLVASPPLWKYLPTPLVGNPIIKILVVVVLVVLVVVVVLVVLVV